MSEIFGVIGAGTMGNGIAQTAAASGYEVVMCDIEADFVKKGFATIEKSLDRFVKKETMTGEQKGSILGRSPATKPVRATERGRPRTDCPYLRWAW